MTHKIQVEFEFWFRPLNIVTQLWLSFLTKIWFSDSNSWRGWFLSCLFRRKSRAIVIARLLLSLLSSCKNFKCYPILKKYLRYQHQTWNTCSSWRSAVHNSESCSFGVMPLVNLLLNMIIWKLLKISTWNLTLNTCLSWYGAIVRQGTLLWK